MPEPSVPPLRSYGRRRVLAIDNDPQGNLTSSFLEKPEQVTAIILDAYDGRRINRMQKGRKIIESVNGQ